MRISRCLFFALLLQAPLLQGPLSGQRLDPIQWKAEAAQQNGASGALVKVTAAIAPGWHLYSLTTPRPPIATSIKVLEPEGAAVLEAYQPDPVRKQDPNFQTETETFEGSPDFYVRLSVPEGAKGEVKYKLESRFQACDDKQCLPPRRKPIEFAVMLDPAAPKLDPPATVKSISAPAAAKKPAGTPQQPAPQPAQDQGLGEFLFVAFSLGLATLFTPCVFPMIPITMSFFLSQSEGGRAKQITQALVFCLGIVVLFTSIGLLVTGLLKGGVSQIASNPWANAGIAAIFLALGLSLLGAFEITLPSGLLTKLNAASSSGGYVGSLIMGLAFSLTSFACVGPFVGTLLAASVQGDRLRPALGMASFSSGLALPFFLIALFPSVLKNLPRSGAWMVRVKVVFGFVVLALMFKYLANIDATLQTGWLTREIFLAIWFVLFALPGLYLLGFLKMEGVNPDEPAGIGRLLPGAAFLIFAVSLLPGMFCRPLLGDLEAYVPFAKGCEVSAAGSASAGGLKWMKNDLPGALALAKAENKRVFVNFTGYACTNCHWMKANMFTRPEVAEAMKEFVLVELYTDGPGAVSEANQKLQETRFQTVAIPYYLILDSSDQVVASYPGLTKDPATWLQFLKS
jgi:thiol:disulfide interchange protein DsbD